MESLHPEPWSELATKRDLAELRGEFHEFRGEMRQFQGETKGALLELSGRVGGLEHEVRAIPARMAMGNLITCGALTALVLAAAKLFGG